METEQGILNEEDSFSENRATKFGDRTIGNSSNESWTELKGEELSF